jgi:hypothetical protein
MRVIFITKDDHSGRAVSRSNAGIVGSNSLEAWKSVCVYSVFVLSCV